MPEINEWKRRRKLAVNKDKRILFKMTRTLPIALLAFWFGSKKSIKSGPLVKELTGRQLKVEQFISLYSYWLIKNEPISAREIKQLSALNDPRRVSRFLTISKINWSHCRDDSKKNRDQFRNGIISEVLQNQTGSSRYHVYNIGLWI